MRQRVLATVARLRFEQSPLGRAQHEKRLSACMAMCDADLERALEISRRISQRSMREAA
jgi:hypothetical protein